MSIAGIYEALELKLRAFDDLPTAFENVNFVPPTDGEGDALPYQEVWVKLAKPENPTMGDGHYRQRGYLQVAVRFPLNGGAGAARTRAGLLRDFFPRGLSLVAGGATTTVEETPEIGSGSKEGDRYVINIFVRFYADIFGA